MAQVLSGQAKEPCIPEIEQSSGLAAAKRPPAVVANRTVTIAADDKPSIERMTFSSPDYDRAPACWVQSPLGSSCHERNGG
jgi:hypothetical protein